MNDKLIKMDEESFLEYSSRIYRMKDKLDLTNFEIYELIKNNTGTELAESSVRCHCSDFNRGYYFKEKELLRNGNEKEIEKLNNKIQELEKIKIQVQDQKREYRNYLRRDSRWEHITSEMVKAINNLDYEYEPIKYNNVKINGNRKASLMLSDWHIGMKNDTSHNVYNLKVAKYRLEKLYNKVVTICERHGVNELNIELLGDLVNGLIHLSTRVNNEEDVISQTMLVAEMLSDFVSKLANKIKVVNVHSTTGNHGRCSANKNDNIEIENFERLITWYMESRLIKFTNVNIFDNYEEDIILYKVFDLTIASVHGEKDGYKEAIKNLSCFLHIFVDELHLGHYHSHNVKTENEMETIVNGTFAGTDEYAEGLRKSSKPSQTLIIYNKDGQECLYNISLR